MISSLAISTAYNILTLLVCPFLVVLFHVLGLYLLYVHSCLFLFGYFGRWESQITSRMLCYTDNQMSRCPSQSNVVNWWKLLKRMTSPSVLYVWTLLLFLTTTIARRPETATHTTNHQAQTARSFLRLMTYHPLARPNLIMFGRVVPVFPSTWSWWLGAW